MLDPRINEHARLLTDYCTNIRSGDNVLIHLGGAKYGGDEGLELAAEIYKRVAKIGANPIIVVFPSEAIRGFLQYAPEESLDRNPRGYYELMRMSEVVIGIGAESNTRFLEDVDPKRVSRYAKAFAPVIREQLKKRWIGTIHPTNAFAQDAEMCLDDFKNLVYSAMFRDWQTESARMVKLKRTMEASDRVRIIGDDTDLTFSISGRTALIDDGRQNNFPGGEVYTAPQEGSIFGKICFDLPALIYGREITGIQLTFRNGVVSDYSATKNSVFLGNLLHIDEGAGRLGEFGIGTNNGISHPTGSMLLNEKMTGTIHLGLGNAYEACGGLNRSAIHWDIVKTMNPGKVTMDERAILEDGRLLLE